MLPPTLWWDHGKEGGQPNGSGGANGNTGNDADPP